MPAANRCGSGCATTRICRTDCAVRAARRRHPRDRLRNYGDVLDTLVESGAGPLRALPLCHSIVGQLRPATHDGARILHGSTPALYERWVREAAMRALALDRPLLFVNAWNEWAEAAVLEPTARWGDAYLVAHRRGVEAAERLRA